ncbi:M20/M25/M40 family metallo-hydrolase [uncultured Winogradskyella sp.]|uniref:M20/M25/M40 family metallo-hydrolase n=1 Tax=uncultured Winogradskyella sp. TaxID=395353 RepID=UPI002604D4F4|nr:M20/M25/M40 family metallo-hydrolase [uncultured Winogradskyella sp.]
MNLKLLKFLALMLFLHIFCSCNGQSLPSISEDNIKSHIKTLASDEFLGRKPGTLGEQKTIQYLAEKLEAIGIEPANGDSYFQEFTISRLKYNKPSAMVISKANGKTSRYESSKDFYSKTSFKANDQISLNEAEIVFVGFGIIAPEYNWDDYKHVDVKDKVVLVLFSDPGFYTKDENMFNGMSVSQYGDYNLKKKLAMERGAKAVFMIHHEFINWDQIGQSSNSGYSSAYVKNQSETVSDGLLCSGIISIPVMKDLLSSSGFEDNYVEQALGKDFKGLHITSKMSLTNSSTPEDVVRTKNVLGILKGSTRPDEHIIYTSHWDHVGTRPSTFGKDSIFNGAIDNASGTAMHLEVARTYKALRRKPERSIVFFFTSAEEMGLLGAEYYANNPIYPLKKAVCVINADGHFATNKMKTATSVLKGYSEMDKYVDNAVAKMDRNAVEDTSPAYMKIFQRSDHYPFVKKGVPAVWAIGNQNPVEGGEAEAQKIANYMQHYHQVTDEYYEGFNAQNIAADALMNFLIGLELANSSAWPNWNKTSKYKEIRDKSIQD